MSDNAQSLRPELRGNNLDLVRQRNLSLILRRVHELGAISRAALTKETALNRSTVAALVAELVQLGLVTETVPHQTNQVGRPSLVIVPGDRAVALTVHPELDAAVICLVALGGRIIHRETHATRGLPSAREFVEITAAAVDRLRPLLDGRFVAGVGLAVPGLVRASDGAVTLAPHLEWRNEPLGAMLREATGFEVVAANDASLGAIAESARGAGRGVDDFVYLNGGASGIGGGVITGGRLLSGAAGYGGELGHTLVNSNGRLCHCGSVGCLETEVQRASLLEALGLPPTEADLLEESLLAELAAGASPLLSDLVDRQLDYLGRALANIVNIFNPRTILLGGFLGSLYEARPERLDAVMRSMSLVGSGDLVTLERATLGTGVIELGAAELAFAALIDDPASASRDSVSTESVEA